jgi:hypothetical protein
MSRSGDVEKGEIVFSRPILGKAICWLSKHGSG